MSDIVERLRDQRTRGTFGCSDVVMAEAADEIATLRRQVAACKVVIAGMDDRAILAGKEFSELSARAVDVAGERAANAILTAEIERLRKDAERYRWLRSRKPGGAHRIEGLIYSDGGHVVDAQIDAAMRATPGAGEG